MGLTLEQASLDFTTLYAEAFADAGDLAMRLGSPRTALGHLKRSLAGHKQVFGANHAYTAAVHHLRGDAYRHKNGGADEHSTCRCKVTPCRQAGE